MKRESAGTLNTFKLITIYCDCFKHYFMRDTAIVYSLSQRPDGQQGIFPAPRFDASIVFTWDSYAVDGEHT